MRKNKLYLIFIGLVAVIVVACAINDAGSFPKSDPAEGNPTENRPVTNIQKAIYSERYDSLGSIFYNRSPGADVERVPMTGAGHPKEGRWLLKITFNAERGSMSFRNTETSVDLTPFADGFIVFSIYYGDLESRIGQLNVGMASGNFSGGGTVDIVNSNYRSSTDANKWHTYQIPLSDFDSYGDLDHEDVSVYFGITEFKDKAGDYLAGPEAIIYLDDVYFEATKQ